MAWGVHGVGERNEGWGLACAASDRGASQLWKTQQPVPAGGMQNR